jgi:uncharacterized membrane protein (UPF0127 family)
VTDSTSLSNAWSRRPLAPSIAAALLFFLTVGCSREPEQTPEDRYAHLLSFDTAQLRIVAAHDTAVVTVELAESEAQHSMGMMERRVLAADAGMLFVFPAMQPDSSAFWMYRTRIPLDIAFVDSAGIIRTIKTMPPCPATLVSGCPSYTADARYTAALEVNAGYFSRKHIRVGDRLLLQDTTARRRATRPTG